MSGIVLVTGAAGGRQGSTGRQVAELLLGRGVPVRAFVHSDDERAERLRGVGAEVVTGDLRDIAQVLPALEGVDRVFFTYPVADGLLDAAAAVAAAAKTHGVRRVVEVSQLTPRPHSHSPRTRQHWLAEQVFDWAGVGAVHLRSIVFYENFRVLATIGLATGELAVPLGDEHNLMPLVAAGDVARIGATLLADPLPPSEQFYLLVGAVPTVGEIAAAFAKVLDRPMPYRNISEREWRDSALARGVNPHAVEHLSRLWQVFRDPEIRKEALYEVTDSVERVTGSAPESLEGFLRANRDVLMSGAQR